LADVHALQDQSGGNSFADLEKKEEKKRKSVTGRITSQCNQQ